MTLQNIVERCVSQAVKVADLEAQDEAIEVGTIVGHINTKKYGCASGILRTYEKNEAYVQLEPNRWVRWNIRGMVSTDRVDQLTNVYLCRVAKTLGQTPSVRRQNVTMMPSIINVSYEVG